ncbi:MULTISPECIES: ATP-binding protein [Bosea]|uniref:ATP-binding protein n=1 Tax=Bosea TaxID=85413 RepID=UPI0021501CB1|nr:MULTISPECIES: ATP-binding protein [Bosea]MCR4520709.1 ATP-binding protein [Bosea sp. 47.2.35]MDR6828349.1 two-component system C4-dicarboxylate transport sensor histidine kinase DctB [Bosea robiniae]MDR6895008.1 two-component system C4-dicarboxylate transport sensor histidine kinase DctB [Bosea sp. BE109]MDR7138426.1 two-component system C4-dicarboxylate transport sensor histidine kinase DctB [Bosea sp. BE168]MDR7175125.1 two-component system C4-dicarboxylate transport sensor histidine kina
MTLPPVKRRFGIGGRLIAAFLGVGLFAVGAGIVGVISYERLSKELAAIAREHLPGLASAARLAEASARVIAGMPELANAERRDGYERGRRVVGERLSELDKVLSERTGSGFDAPQLTAVAAEIRRNLNAIDDVSGRRFTLAERIRGVSEELRWLQADLIDEIEPLTDDARFNIDTALGQTSGETSSNKPNTIREETRKSEALMTLNAQANLIVGLFGRLGTVQTREDMEQTGHVIGEAVDQLEVEAKALAGWPDTITVRQITQRLVGLADTTTGLPGFKRAELAALADAQRLISESRRLVAELGTLVSQEVQRTEAVAKEAADRSAEAIRLGRNLLLAIAAASLLGALLIGWFYVRRHLVARLRVLTEAATSIASGQSSALLPKAGNDELGDLVRALAVFRQTRDDLIQAAKLAALGQMAAGLSHELNQPLAAIRSHAHNGALLLERGRPEEARKAIGRIQALTTRAADLIAHLRRFARKPGVVLNPVAVGDTIDTALSLFEPRFEAERVTLTRELPAGRLHVHAEEIRLEQVLVNLIANALDAVAGMQDAAIAIGARRAGHKVEIWVADNGPGIDRAHLERIFDPFFTTKPVGSGLGLGLSLSYNIIKDLGGTLAVAETGPAGTRFLITLEGTTAHVMAPLEIDA